MTKEIWLGPVLGTNRERLLARCSEFLAHGKSDQLLYLAASHPLLDLVTERLLDGQKSSGVWGEFPVYLFRGFVRRVLSNAITSPAEASDAQPMTFGFGPRLPIDREELPLRHSLISQIIKQLGAAGKLNAIRPLANRDGCVNTMASLIGELQRAGKTAIEFSQIVEARAQLQSPKPKASSKKKETKSQIDFDREVALIYSIYADTLDRFGLTDEDAEQLRALQVFRGEKGPETSLSWLNQIDLLVLDGFFDFTPVQGEILKFLIPAIPNVIVNLNADARNEDIFRPFESTVQHLTAITDFAILNHDETKVVEPSLSLLRERLFSSGIAAVSGDARSDSSGTTPAQVTLLECYDREVEIKSIAREIKRLILVADYKLADIALVVRERASYADTILRVCADEAIPCNLERRAEAQHIPALRACGKLFQLLKETTREHFKNPKAVDLAHLIKTDYFRLAPAELENLTRVFDSRFAGLIDAESTKPGTSEEKQRLRLGIGQWLTDVLENVIAYVGSDLRTNSWIERAEKLINQFPSAEAAQRLIAGAEVDDQAAVAADEAPTEDGAVAERRQRPSPIHPATIGWTVVVIERLQQLIAQMPEEGTPDELRSSLMRLLEQLEFSRQVNLPLHRKQGLVDVPQATLDVRGLEALRRAVAAAMRSFNYAAAAIAETPSSERVIPGLPRRVHLSSFIEEVERSIRSQTLSVSAGDRDGLRVLEATDIRGLHFPIIFVAGMIEGGFPLRTSRDWLYPHEERLRLQKEGVFLEDISTDTLLKEEHYFYQVACRATKHLYLTRPLALSDGAETVPSYYLEELKRALAPANIDVRQLRGDVDSRKIEEASTRAELSALLIHQTESRNAAKLLSLLSQVEKAGLISESAMRRVGIERQRSSDRFGSFDGEITDPDLKLMMLKYFGAEHVYSASRFSTYGNCPFRFFASRVLKIEPRSEAALDLQAIDAGKLLHDILRRFFQEYRREYLPDLDREKLRTDLAKTAEEVFREHERKVPPLNQRIWKIDCEIRKLILDQVLLYELRLQEKIGSRGVRPTYFELAFGYAAQASDPKSTSKFLKLRRPANRVDVALVQGQIDRVDLDEHGQVAVAYDYKLSQGAKLDDIQEGRQVQIPIYLAALEQLFLPETAELAGGGYYKLRARGPRLNQGLFRKMFERSTNTTPASKFDDEEWTDIRRQVEARVWEFIDGFRNGHFRVKPSRGKSTCKFCDYSAVCRYDNYRISRKR